MQHTKTKNIPTNGRKIPANVYPQLSLLPAFVPVTAYDLAVWLYGVTHNNLDTRGLVHLIRDFRYLQKIEQTKAENWPEWLKIEKRAADVAARWCGGCGYAALRLSADSLQPMFLEAAGFGRRQDVT